MEKLLEDGHLKLSSVISDIHGVSGRDMLNAIAAGQRDPKALAQLARGTMRGKIRRLEEALDCSFFTDQHAAVLAMMLAAIDHYTAQIDVLTATIEALAEPYLRQSPARRRPRHRDNLRPGHHRRDRRRHDRLPHRLPPGLLGQMVTPGQTVRRQAQGQQLNRPRQPLPGRRPRRSRHIRRPHPSFLGARYRRLARRMPKKKALVATGNSMLAIVHALLSDPEPATRPRPRTITSSACTPAARPATTSAAWNASATRSPSRPSTLTPASSRPQPAAPALPKARRR